MVSVRDSYISEDFELTTDEGFMIAFGITAFDNEQLSIEDDTYGKLKGYYKTWNASEGQGVTFEEIPTSKCTRAQLGLV